MTSRDFAYWLQGFFELSVDEDVNTLKGFQVELIKKHLSMVFHHEIDPSMGGTEHQGKLNALHQGLENIILTGQEDQVDLNPNHGITTPDHTPSSTVEVEADGVIDVPLNFMGHSSNNQGPLKYRC